MTLDIAPSTNRLWVVLTFGDDRQHAGNAGYDDAPEKWYSYDSFVANHRQIAVGDCLILCSRKRSLGVARIIDIDEEPSTRLLQRCPSCQDTGIKKRISKTPAYRCKNGHEFEDPARENASCTKYVARFGLTFRPFTDTLGRDFLRRGCPRYSDQVAMQEIVLSFIEADLRRDFPQAANTIINVNSAPFLLAEMAEDERSAKRGYNPTEADERENVMRQIRARRGQQGFRDRLRIRYGDQCLISGSKALPVLEAAHIRPYRGESDNHSDNGLLLRADLHTLFDLDLIGIEPVSLAVHVHPHLIGSEYGDLSGRVLLCSRSRPDEEALRSRWQAFQVALSSDRS